MREFPDAFWIPSFDERNGLLEDAFVKLIYRIRVVEGDGREAIAVERMWTRVVAREGRFYRGCLDNDPYCETSVRAGLELFFEPRHVIAIDAF